MKKSAKDIKATPNKLYEKHLFSNPEKMIKVLNKRKAKYLMKRTTESTTIIWNNTKFIYSHSSVFPRHKLFLFKHVKNDVEKWLKNRENIALPPQHDVANFNLDYDNSYGSLIGTDLNHAYWRIAFIKGIICERTYNYGLDPECKALRLATISVLGRKKKFIQYEKGAQQEQVIVDEGDEQLRLIYKYIRFFCYQLMHELALKLGDDFECWKTDCIYYRNTKENIEMVSNYLTEKQIDFKLLTE